jgi:hypothetical protein
MNVPAISERPENLLDRRRTSFADVFMLLAKDGPVYAIIVVVGILAMRGTASTAEAVIAALAALLSKSWPRPIQMGTGAAIALLIGGRIVMGCAPEAVPLAAKDIVVMADYSNALDRCIAEGHDAGTLAAYERCAELADQKFGRKDASP